MSSFKNWVRNAFHAGGGLSAARHLRRNGARILTYHRFREDYRAQIAEQCKYLQVHYRPVPLSQVIASLLHDASLPPKSVAVTIDDGYRDIYQVAFPEFQRYGIPATAFLTTGFLDGRCWLWVDQVRYIFEHTRRTEATIREHRFPLATPEQREQAIIRVKEAAKRMPDAARREWIASLPDEFDVKLPERCPDTCAPLTWNEVRTMRERGFEFGAHTITHPILANLNNQADLDQEIAGSKRRLEEALQEPVQVFCYPNGRYADITAAAREAVRSAGFEAAVTTESGRNFPGADPFLLRRIGVDASDDLPYFRERVAELARV